MANDLTTNPIYLDTFSSDITLAAAGKPLHIKSVSFRGTANDVFTIEDGAGTNIVNIKVDSVAPQEVLVNQWFTGPIIVDVSDGAYNSAIAVIQQ